MNRKCEKKNPIRKRNNDGSEKNNYNIVGNITLLECNMDINVKLEYIGRSVQITRQDRWTTYRI